MRSCLYECQVMHRRFTPTEHQFVHGIFMFALDLDELNTLPGKLALFSVNRRNLYSFRESDYLPTAEPSHNPSAERQPGAGADRTLKERVLAFLGQHGVDLPQGRVVLVTLPRVLGYLFNPVSFYFCYDRDGTPVAALAEVTNTFREMKLYFLGTGTDLGPEAAGARVFRRRTPKHFYVSPFSDVDVAFDFNLRAPDERLTVQINDYAGAELTLTSTVSGTRRELTGARLTGWTIKYPLLTLRIIALIHWHALLLKLKRTPWFPKAARAADQRDLYRPHASISPAHSTDSP